jgi:transcriptional regulator with XRE-family HTH domain
VVPPKDALKSVGSLIRAKRTSAGLTQHALATRAGLSDKYVSEIERGTRDIPFSTLHAIVESGLGLTLEVGFPTKGRSPTRPPMPKAVDELARLIAELPAETRGEVIAIVRDIIKLAER